MGGDESTFGRGETNQIRLVLVFFGRGPFGRVSAVQDRRRWHGNVLDRFFANVLIDFA